MGGEGGGGGGECKGEEERCMIVARHFSCPFAVSCHFLESC